MQPNVKTPPITIHSGQKLAPTQGPDDLIGMIVPDRSFALYPIAEHNKCAAIPMTLKWLRQQPRAVFLVSALLLSISLGWFGATLYVKKHGHDQARGHEACLATKAVSVLTEARAFLLQTANPSHTMVKQGPEFAINHLHPEFAVRLRKQSASSSRNTPP